jgi:phage shock protein PspC (stress-responsive transcriptional regulator)
MDLFIRTLAEIITVISMLLGFSFLVCGIIYIIWLILVTINLKTNQSIDKIIKKIKRIF